MGVERRDKAPLLARPFSEERIYVNGRQSDDAATPIDFPVVTTTGGCRFSPDGKALLITPLPSDRGPKFAVRLRAAVLPWKLPELTHIEEVAKDGKLSNRQPLRRDGNTIVIECEPGVFGYRLSGSE